MAIYSYSISIFACDEDKEYSYIGIVSAKDVVNATLSISKRMEYPQKSYH